MKKHIYSSIKKISSLFVALILVSGYSVYGQGNYCPVTFSVGCGNGHYISNAATTGGINNFSNSSTCSAGSYADYTGTSMKVTQEALKKVTLKVTNKAPGGNGAISRVYIDWNQNDTFEVGVTPSEYVQPNLPQDHVHSDGGSTVSIEITVPGQAKAGMTRMRIVTGTSSLNFYDPGTSQCGTAFYGEAEDYNFEVINPCIAPSVISASNIDFESVDLTWSQRLNAVMYEYIVKRTPDSPTSIGYSYTTVNGVDIDTLACDMKYYVFVRAVCDTTGISTNWEMSPWKVDSFETEPCCYAPNLTLKGGSLTHSTAQVTWDPIQTAYAYEYAVSTLENSPPQQGTFTTQTGLFLQGLSGRKKYCLYVRALCTPTPQSEWSILCFKTLPGVGIESIAEQQPLAINAYPNPVNDKLNIKLEGYMAKGAKVSLINVTGQLLYKADVQSDELEINTSELAAGVYILKYEDDKRTQVQRIMKQ